MNIMSETIMLRRTGSAALRITGEQIAESSSKELGGKPSVRWYEVRLYRLTDGRLAYQVSFRTEWKGEVDHDWAAVFPDEKSLVATIEEIHTPDRIGFPPGDKYAERQEALLDDLDRHYQNAVSRAFDDGDIAIDA